jgi:hypothetical protein
MLVRAQYRDRIIFTIHLGVLFGVLYRTLNNLDTDELRDVLIKLDNNYLV